MHRQITKQNYTIEEKKALAKTIKELYPKKQDAIVTQQVAALRTDVIEAALLHKKCWYVSCGGSAANTFQLALGDKLPRRQAIPNRVYHDEFDNFEGEANLLVWCSWRLDSSSGPLSSSDDMSEHVLPALKALIGREIADVRIDLPGWDLHLTFSEDRVLHVFCDHVPGDPSFDGNWDLTLPDRIIGIGVGSKWEEEMR